MTPPKPQPLATRGAAFALFGILLTMLAAPLAWAAAGDPDTVFNTNVGTTLGGGQVNAVAVQSNDKIVVAGSFTTLNSPSNRLARFNADGTPDTAFNTNAGATLGLTGGGSGQSVLVQSDGKIVVAGTFYAPCHFLARFNADGTPDTAFNTNVGTSLGSPTTDGAYGVAVQADGKLVVVGNWGSGPPSGYVARFNANGTLDTAFNASIGSNVQGPAYTVAVLANGQLLIGTGQTEFQSKNLIRINADGTLDTAFNTTLSAAGLNGLVRTLRVDPNGKIVVAGSFTTPSNRLARFNADGSLDTAFNTNVGASLGNNIGRSVAIQPDGTLVVGGSFTTSARYLTRFDANGTPDTAFNTAVGTSIGSTVNSVALQSDGKIVVGGAFTTPSRRLARFGGSTVAAPGAPTALMATPGDSQAVIAFTAPTSDGGSAITNYEYSTDNGTNWTARNPAATTSPVTITGLTNGTTYQIKLRAVNSAGAGAASTAVAVTPALCGPGIALTTGALALWQQLALPCVPTTATVQGALGSGNPGNLLPGNYNSANYNTSANWWRFYHYNASAPTPGYVLPALGDAVSVGTGYWLKSFDPPEGGGNLTVTGTTTVPDVTQAQGCAVAAGCKAVPLTVIPILAGSRYQLIGNPFPYHVDWSKVRIRVGGAGGTVYTPTAAEDAGVLSKQIWIWNGTNYDNWDDITQPGKLQYFKSFWVRMLPGASGLTLELLIPAEASTLGQAAPAGLPWYLAWLDAIVPPAHAADGEWQVRLQVENRVTGWKDTTNLLGQKTAAQTGYDPHDLIGMAPFATPYLSLVFPHLDWPTLNGQKRAGDYDTDFRPAQGNPPATWSFELRASPTGGKVFLTWQGDPAILKRSRLVDLQTGRSIDPTATAYAQGYPVVLRQKVQRYQWRYLGR